MKKLLTLSFLLICFSINAQLFHEELVSRNLTVQQIIDQTENHYSDRDKKRRGTGYKQFQRWRYWALRNMDANGMLRSNRKALESYNRFRNIYGVNQRTISGNYTELGPQSTVPTSTWSSALGRVSAIGHDENNDNHIIVGSPTGGIWKTLDLGANWIPLFDDQLLMDVYSLEISHDNPDIYWAGLSEGLLRSIDGGSSWQTVRGLTSGLFNTIEMHPNDPSLVFAIRQSPSTGEVWRSDDGGQNFTMVFEHTSSMYDLEFHPTNPDIIYASGNGGVFMSTDKGISYSEITTGLWSGNPFNTMMVAVTPAAPSNIYVLEEAGGGFNALYHSTNEGLTWNTITDNACECLNLMGIDLFENVGQGPRDMDIVVSPVDPNIIHVAGIETYRTQNLGQNWQQTTEWNNPGQPNFIHADIDLLIYDDERILAGTDGGIYFSTDDGTSWTDISSGLGIRQLYRMGASQTDVDRVSGGSQDNGTGILVSGTWFDWLGADGMETFVDFSNSNIVYGTSQNGGLYKSLDGGQSRVLINEPGVAGNWVTPFEQDPIDPNTIYTARKRLWKSIDGGINWADILQFDPAGRADEMAIAPSDNNYIYVSYFNNLYYSSDGGNNWESNDLPGSQLNYIIVHPFDPQRVAIVISGANAKIMESFDGGVSFVDITGNIPTDVSIECVVYEQLPNGGLFVGGNPGIYYTADSSNPNWLDNTINLPKVRITELELRNQVMYVSTYGRGLWKFEFGCDSSMVGQACNDFDVCTMNDVFDANCECAGVASDSDGDGVCDGLDVCNGGDDNTDGDNDGIPDLCDGCAIGCTDSDCDSVCDVDDICPNGDDTRDSDGDGIPDYCDDCNDDDYDGICNENDICEGSDSSDVDGDGIPDGCDDCNDLVQTPAIRLEIKLDGFPGETSWEIVNDLGNIVFSSVDYVNFAPGDIVIETFCSINTGCYDFIFRDDFGDGICCLEGDGYYLLTNSGGDILASGGEFNDLEITEFCLSSNCGSSGNDSDSDGICDDLDCDDNDANVRGLGSTCNDFNVCTTEDVYDSNCNCIGVLIDSDSDGICDLNDICAGSDDNIDSDNDGIPDGCDDCDNFIETFIVNVEIKLDNYPDETHWEIMDDSGDIVFSNLDYDSFSSGDIIQDSYCPFNEGCYNFTIYDAFGDGICCLQGDGYYLLTNQIGDTIAYGGEFRFSESTEFCFSNCISSGGDSDSDGICDLNDLCPGSDDNIDTDSDGIPDGCDDCVDTEKTIDGEFDEIDSPSIPNWIASEGGGASMSSTINHYNKAVLDIIDPGTFNYNLQLWQDDLTMEADKLYVIQTDLRADRTRFVTLKLRNIPNGTTYFERDIEVFSRSKEMAFIFRSPVVDNDLRLTLQVGGNSESVYVDHIRFREFCANDHDLLDCLDQLTIDDDLVDSDLFKAVERIESAALISNFSQIEYQAGDNILLLPDFEVEQGVIFVADIKACTN